MYKTFQSGNVFVRFLMEFFFFQSSSLKRFFVLQNEILTISSIIHFIYWIDVINAHTTMVFSYFLFYYSIQLS